MSEPDEDLLVVWNICYVSIQLGMSSSQLLLTHIFQRGRGRVGLNHQPEEYSSPDS